MIVKTTHRLVYIAKTIQFVNVHFFVLKFQREAVLLTLDLQDMYSILLTVPRKKTLFTPFT